MALLTRRENFIEIFSATLGFLLGVIAFPRLIPPRDPLVDFWGLSHGHSEDGPHTLLNGALRWIPITLTWECCNDLLNMCLQHLIEA
jgi:hypothetical protein